MDAAITCGACQHVSALHRAGGPCRLNGCPCQGFASPLVEPPLEPTYPEPAPQESRAFAIAQKVAAAAIAFVAGVLVGQNL